MAKDGPCKSTGTTHGCHVIELHQWPMMTAARLTIGRRLHHAGRGTAAIAFASSLCHDISIIHSMATHTSSPESEIGAMKVGPDSDATVVTPVQTAAYTNDNRSSSFLRFRHVINRSDDSAGIRCCLYWTHLVQIGLQAASA